MGLRRIYTAVQKVLSGALIEIEAVDMSSGQLRFLLCKAFQLLTLSFSVLGLRVLCGGDKSDLYQGLRRHHRKVSGEASYVWDSGFWVGGGGGGLRFGVLRVLGGLGSTRGSRAFFLLNIEARGFLDDLY